MQIQTSQPIVQISSQEARIAFPEVSANLLVGNDNSPKIDIHVPAANTSLPITPSTDGHCGAQQNWTNTCVGSKFGNCCNATGQ